jgi:SAM-dependent methyltransferase
MPLSAMLRRFVYRHRLPAKRAAAFAIRALPSPAARRLRNVAEHVAFRLTPQYQAETLPPIFRYWSRRHLSPTARELGIRTPEAFFLERVRAAAIGARAPVRVLSVGTGACEMEIGMAAQLRSDGRDAHVTCMDINPALLRRAAATARQRGVAEMLTFQARDCNQPFELPAQDVIIVNQFFHHVAALEILCQSLRRSLAADGVLLSSDIIGRNGHQLWPDTETVVQRAWTSLPREQRFDRHSNSAPTRYRSINHAAWSNEGVRAQDIVGCLLETFDFELFFSFGGAIMPFIERRIGFNFDPDDASDRDWIDRLHVSDATALAEKRYPGVNMIAALRHPGCVQTTRFVPTSPHEHLRLVRDQQRRIAGAGRRGLLPHPPS